MINSASIETSALTGICAVVYRDPDVPSDTTAVIRRAPSNISGEGVYSPGEFVEIGRIENCDVRGSHFIDVLPMSNEVYWYEAYHTHPDYSDSDTVFMVSGSPAVIPNIDFNSKPWDNVTPLQLIMLVTGSTSQFWYVTGSVNQTVYGGRVGEPIITPHITGNVAYVESGKASGSFHVGKPFGFQSGSASGSENTLPPSWVVFKSELAGYLPGFDKVEFPPTTSSLAFVRLNADVIEEFTTASLVAISASISPPVSATLALVIEEQHRIPFLNVQQAWNGRTAAYIAGRPTGSTNGFIRFAATSSVPNIVGDSDTAVILRQDFTTNDFLRLILHVTASHADWVGISGSAYNEDNVPVSYSVWSTENLGTVTQDAHSQFTIQRPAQGLGRITIVATSDDEDTVYDFDSLDIQADSDLTPDQFLQLQLHVTSSTLTHMGISASCDTSEPIGFGVLNSQNVGTITRDAASRWTIQRPTGAFEQGSVMFIVSSSNANVLSDTDTIFVTKDPSPYLIVSARNISSDNSTVRVMVDIADSNQETGNLDGIVLNHVTSSLFGLSVTPVGGLSQSSGLDHYTYDITRPAYGQGTGRVTFLATKKGYTRDSDSIEVPESVNNLANLDVSLTITAMTSQSMTISASAVDPLSAATVTLSASMHGAQFSYTGTNPYNVERPNYGSGQGQFKVVATADDRVSDSDTVEIPERVDGVARLKLNLHLLNYTDTTYLVSASYRDPLGTASGSYHVSITPTDSTTYSGSNPWTIERPPSGSAVSRFNVEVRAASRIEDSDAIDVVPTATNLQLQTLLHIIAQTSGTLSVSASVTDPLEQSLSGLQYSASITHPFSYTGTNPWVIQKPTGSLTGRFTVRTTATGRTSDFDALDLMGFVNIPSGTAPTGRQWKVRDATQYYAGTQPVLRFKAYRYTDAEGGASEETSLDYFSSGEWGVVRADGIIEPSDAATFSRSGSYFYTSASAAYVSSFPGQPFYLRFTMAPFENSGIVTTEETDFSFEYPLELPTGLRAANAVAITNGTANFSSLTVGGSPVLTSAPTSVPTASFASVLGGKSGSFYQDASNINAGTLNNARLPSAISVTSLAGDGSGITNIVSSSHAIRSDSTRIASNANTLGGQSASFYTELGNMGGTIQNSSLPANISVTSLAGDGSGITGVVSSSYAVTASYVTAESSNGVMRNRGEWVSLTQYFPGDVVQESGTSYVCVAPYNGSDAPSATILGLYWDILAAQGPQGPQGNDGNDGNDGADGIVRVHVYQVAPTGSGGAIKGELWAVW